MDETILNAFKAIVKKCDLIINMDEYEADPYVQCIVEDISEIANRVIDRYGK